MHDAIRTRTRIGILGLVATLVLVAHDARAQARKRAVAPDSVARGALLAHKDGRLDDFARAMHPEALASLKAEIVSIMDAAATSGQEDQLLSFLGSSRTSNELKALNDPQFFVAFYAGMTRFRPGTKDVLGDIRTLGYVMEGRDTAHVVCRMPAPSSKPTGSTIDVVSMRRTETGWGMLPTADIEGLMNLLEQRFGKKP